MSGDSKSFFLINKDHFFENKNRARHRVGNALSRNARSTQLQSNPWFYFSTTPWTASSPAAPCLSRFAWTAPSAAPHPNSAWQPSNTGNSPSFGAPCITLEQSSPMPYSHLQHQARITFIGASTCDDITIQEKPHVVLPCAVAFLHLKNAIVPNVSEVNRHS